MFAAQLPCYLVNNLTTTSIEQCKFIIDNGCQESDAEFDYVYLVYCELGLELRYLSIALIVLLVIILFLALSSVADEFLCPSLLTVAKNLRMSDSLAGVTLLAFGNGCPDIFSSLAAASDDRSELIIGELLGAGIFCTSIVSGLIFLHSDFKLACRPILRDATFFLLAIYLIWFYCSSKAITFYGSLAFIIIYVIYLIVALGGQALHSRLMGNYAIAESMQAADLKQHSTTARERNTDENWFLSRGEEFLKSSSLIALSERRSETTSLGSSIVRHNSHRGVTTIQIGARSIPERQCEQSFELPTIKLAATDSANFGGHLNGAFEKEPSPDCSDQSVASLSRCTQSKGAPTFCEPTTISLENPIYSQQQPNGPDQWDDFLGHINPVDSENWRQINYLTKLMRILRAPLLFVALITVPVVDTDRPLGNWCRPLNSLHCITVPLTILLATRLAASDTLNLLGVPLPVLVFLPSCLVAAFVFKTTSARRAPKYQPAFAYVGFIMSVLWIYLLATEILGLLKTVGIIFSLTDTAIGLGILAWGNSLGDIVANISLAEAGYPRMAIGASIGAPLLNLLLGFGLSFTINLRPGEISAVEYSPMITLLCSTLAIILILLMLSTLAAPERSKKPFGYLLIASYGIYFTIAVCIEYELIKF